MPAIPEFVLRKLLVPGSLKASDQGFDLQLKNTLAPVTLTRLGIIADERECERQGILLRLPLANELTAASITSDRPFSLAMNTLISVSVKSPMPCKKLVIQVDTREAGALQFGIPVRNAEPETGMLKDVLERTRRSFQAFIRAWRARQDPQHPKFHFAPPANWMNDPNGLIYWKGTYHMFYQYNPFEAVWGNIHWGHASSRDMLHWKHHPIALTPDPGGADAGGCFSGCAVEDDGVATLIYTGVFPEVQCMARSSTPDLVTWKKHPRPLISAPPDGMEVEGFRDPHVWKEGSEWRMVVGSGIHNQGGAVLLYRSRDLLEWEFLGILFQETRLEADGEETGTMWECPSFFKLVRKWVLILSVTNPKGPINTIFYVGNYVKDQFIPDGPAQMLDHGAGACLYAPQTFLSGSGERVMFGWLREGRGVEEMKRAGWSGAMSLPRRLSLSGEGRLVCAPLAGIASLRGRSETLSKDGQLSEVVVGARMEILARVQPRAKKWSGIHLVKGKASEVAVLIGWDSLKGEIIMDCRQAGGLLSSLPPEKAGQDELLLHIFVDGSVLEVFVDDQQAMSGRFYIQELHALRVQLVGKALAEVWALAL